MTQSGFIAAIDLGTSKITGVIGRKNENNVISVLAYESLPAENSIRRGAVYNINNAGALIRKLISHLENKLSVKIGKVYVSIAGQSVHTEVIRETKQLSSSGTVTENVVAELRATAEKYKPDMQSKYAIADVEYFLDDKPEKNPVGVVCSVIDAEYQIVVGRPNLSINIERIIEEKASLQIADYIVGPLAAAGIALTDEEKELGCAFIDFGAGTSELLIFKNGLIRHLVTIPFGGRTITKDIAELNFVESDAEQYKTKFGSVGQKNEKEARTSLFSSPFSTSPKPDKDLEELNKVIAMRLDEIVVNIKNQINLSGYREQLGAGVVITGGASQLKNLDSYLAEKLGMPVRKASARKNHVNNSPELANNPAMTTALGMLLLGNINCEKVVVEPIETDIEFESDGTERGSRGWGTIFGGGGEKKPKPPRKPKKEPTEGKTTNVGGKMKNLFSDISGGIAGMFEEDDE